MLPGFRSRCATEECCRYATPSINCTASTPTASSEVEASKEKNCDKGDSSGSTINLPSTTSTSGIMRVFFVYWLPCRHRSTSTSCWSVSLRMTGLPSAHVAQSILVDSLRLRSTLPFSFSRKEERTERSDLKPSTSGGKVHPARSSSSMSAPLSRISFLASLSPGSPKVWHVAMQGVASDNTISATSQPEKTLTGKRQQFNIRGTTQ